MFLNHPARLSPTKPIPVATHPILGLARLVSLPGRCYATPGLKYQGILVAKILREIHIWNAVERKSQPLIPCFFVGILLLNYENPKYE